MPVASIGIFRKDLQIKKPKSKLDVPIEVFQAARRVMDSEQEEIVHTQIGIFLITYAPFGPFKQPIKTEDQWLPVHITRFEKWSSGGIRNSEMSQYLEKKDE